LTIATLGSIDLMKGHDPTRADMPARDTKELRGGGLVDKDGPPEDGVKRFGRRKVLKRGHVKDDPLEAAVMGVYFGVSYGVRGASRRPNPTVR
jgi:hypothetical protein